MILFFIARPPRLIIFSRKYFSRQDIVIDADNPNHVAGYARITW